MSVGSCLSQVYDLEMGVLQGSIFSVTLFGLKINSIVNTISPGLECSFYVDDFLICYRSKYIHIIEKAHSTMPKQIVGLGRHQRLQIFFL